MFTTVTTAKAPVEVEFFGKYHIALGVIVKINLLLQRLLHLTAVLWFASSAV